MGILKKCIVNNFNIVEGKNTATMVKIACGYGYKRIDNREEIKDIIRLIFMRIVHRD